MRAPRFTIPALLVFVAVVAADCGLVRLFFRDTMLGILLGRGTFLMLNVLAVVGYRCLASGPRKAPSLVGFLLAGGASVILYVVLCVAFPSEAYDATERFAVIPSVAPCYYFLPSLMRAYYDGERVARLTIPVIVLPIQAILIGVPQLAFAVIGGRLAQGWRARQRPPEGNSAES